ncbi:DUF4878 domain-containing protein [Campylobacter sp. Cr9]|uniref:DUF4878 domain-containing protein n=1 Tax=unclassified Campylobacter TaxID=2593542 RepID=UPI001EFC2626|nr:DUF4878 domain-containing protein [Campylobacter sp. RM5004]MBZ7986386.1 DUF4878 domain-containing protein [Campylobacter sp. Cr9]ULO02379.1 DUF4878 domain-containing protein [Campylobacter sp. RM5004]
MKKLLSFIAVAFMFVACGSETPEEVAKNFAKLALEGENEQALKCVYFKSEDEKQEKIKEAIKYEYGAKAKKEVAEKGGIQSIEASRLEQIENLAKVKVVVTYKNGDVKDNKLNLIKIKDKWYINNSNDYD